MLELPGVWRRHGAAVPEVPLVMDSPHSGTSYPADYRHAAPLATLRRAEDTHVDVLFGDAPRFGATRLDALFPRSYIDVNRALDDLDPELLDGPWPEPLAPGTKTTLGIGLVSRLCGAMVPIYDRPLAVDEVRGRIDRCWRPYHTELERLIEATHARFGAVFHVNCHSMPAVGADGMALDAGRPRADFVLGDRDGTTCAEAFVGTAERFLAARGYDVRRNDPFKGVEIVRKFGRPGAGRHSLQIEINRRLYMNEDTREPNDGFARLRAALAGLVECLAGFARDRAAVTARTAP
ncbi:MAG: N-formylglutamate amidohydrolase [Alphaproteobacteria bacterium]|nr:N-formylglutamate amidohydrolase [Alphaproteobacteria bacterium]